MCRALIQKYRDINARRRETPPPAYFSEPWKSKKTVEIPEVNVAINKFDKELKNIDTITQLVIKKTNEVEKIAQDAIGSIENIGDPKS